MPIKFWSESVLAAAHLINRTPSSLLHGKTPYECLYGKAPSYADLKTFGCLCFAHNLQRHKDKFVARSRKCVFIGYPFGKRGWRLYDLESEKFFTSRDVVFHESEFPFQSDSSGINTTVPQSVHPVLGTKETEPQIDLRGSDITEPPVIHDKPTESELVPVIEVPSSSEEETQLAVTSETETVAQVDETAAVTETVEVLGRGHMVAKPSVRLKDYVTYNAQCHTDKHCSRLSPSPSVSFKMCPGKISSYPISAYVTDAIFSDKHCAFLAAISADKVPRNFKEAMLSPEFRDAMGT